jgi:hypothetical protein
MAPVELRRLARWEHQGNEGLGLGEAALRLFPGFDNPLHAVAGPGIAFRLQALEQAPGSAPLPLRTLRILL